MVLRVRAAVGRAENDRGPRLNDSLVPALHLCGQTPELSRSAALTCINFIFLKRLEPLRLRHSKFRDDKNACVPGILVSGASGAKTAGDCTS